MPNVIVIRNQYTDSRALFQMLEYALSGALKGGYAVKVMPRSRHPKKASEEVIETSKKLKLS